MRILVADDEQSSRLIAEVVLRHLGHVPQSVSNGIEAWETFRACRPDVVISDWAMPGLTGLDLCRNIRAQPGDYVYFILVTSHGGRANILEGMHAGADDYLIKPLDTDDLQARLVAAARVSSLYQQLAGQQRELQQLNDDLAELARRDPLTTLGNRRALTEDRELLEARVNRYGHSYCIALVDVDQFKTYNDTYGHQAGDEVLCAVAAELRTQARSGDALYRYGGDEFLCIFPEQSVSDGAIAVERMRVAVEQLSIPHLGTRTGVVSVSAGLATLDSSRQRSMNDVLKEADDALYRAKQLGRNRVEHAEERLHATAEQ